MNAHVSLSIRLQSMFRMWKTNLDAPFVGLLLHDLSYFLLGEPKVEVAVELRRDATARYPRLACHALDVVDQFDRTGKLLPWHSRQPDQAVRKQSQAIMQDAAETTSDHRRKYAPADTLILQIGTSKQGMYI